VIPTNSEKQFPGRAHGERRGGGEARTDDDAIVEIWERWLRPYATVLAAPKIDFERAWHPD
jgi:hypothetical protein